MTFVQRLDLRQSPALVMTPQLQQAIKLLQLSNLELTQFVAQEVENNPLIESAGQTDQELPEPDEDQERVQLEPPGSHASADADASRIDAGEITEENGDLADGIQTLDDADRRDFVGATDSPTYDGEFSDPMRHLSEKPTLHDHLSAQLNVAFTNPKLRLVGAALIEATEPSGYLTNGAQTPGEIAASLGVDIEVVETVLKTMQQFTPSGVMARNLGECLALQLRDRDRYDPAMVALCRNLDLLGARRLADLQRICGVDSADLADMIAEIRALNPKPGEQFDSSVAQTVVPDILMHATPGGGWAVELNPETLPRVLINRRYYTEVRRACHTSKDRAYLTEKLAEANWLIRSLEQRANTILKVASEIVRQQDGFFTKGVSALRPLALRTIAELIDMHESTVSRVTTNKYIATPRGLFELKYFFSVGIQSANGEESFAAKAIQHRLKSLIAAENPHAVLSDDTLVEQLQREGIDIARRTVAKYREQMGISSSVQRRREKSMRLPATG